MRKITKVLFGLIMAVLVAATCIETFETVRAAETVSQLKAPKVKSKKATNDTVSITWKKVKGAAGYNVYMYDSSKKVYAQYKMLSKTSCTVTGLDSGKTYKFKLSAYSDNNGIKQEGKLSKVIKIRTKKTVVLNAPDFTVCDADGKDHKLSDYAGKPIVINIWATWCGPCVGELPNFEKMYKKYGNEVQFMMVDIETKSDFEDVSSFISYYGYTFPVFYDWYGSAYKAYGTGYVPVTIAINAKGEIVYNEVGGLSESKLESVIKSALK